MNLKDICPSIKDWKAKYSPTFDTSWKYKNHWRNLGKTDRQERKCNYPMVGHNNNNDRCVDLLRPVMDQSLYRKLINHMSLT